MPTAKDVPETVAPEVPTGKAVPVVLRVTGYRFTRNWGCVLGHKNYFWAAETVLKLPEDSDQIGDLHQMGAPLAPVEE